MKQHPFKVGRENYLKRRQRLIDAGLMIGHSRLQGQIMLLSPQEGWEPIDLDKAERHLLPAGQTQST